MRVNARAGLVLAISLLGPALAGGQVPSAVPAADPEVRRPPRRPLAIRADLGGSEPGTSRQAFEGVVSYRPEAPWELQAGYSYSDQVYFSSNRGFATAYRHYAEGESYLKADATLRRYSYPADPAVRRPNPDSNAYDWVPRGELEVSHAFGPRLRGGLQYQLFPASFFHDSSSWSVNHKLSGEVQVRPAPPLRLGVRAALLRDPDPDATAILGRQVPGAAPGTLAPRTRVAYRTTSLLGGFGALELDEVSVKLEYLPNRDLDNSYDWSLLTTVDLRLLAWLELRLQQVHDAYAPVSNFPGRTAEIWMGAASFAVSEALRLRAGYRHVDSPARTGGTVVAGLEWRTDLP